MAFDILPASTDDAAALAELSAETFTATFGHLYETKSVGAFLEENHSAGVYRKLLTDPDYGLWFAREEGGRLVGYAVAGPCSLPVPELPPNSGELARLYLRKEAQGSGLGRRLMAVALGFLNARYDRIYLSVYSENRNAQRFYERFGFVKIHDYFFQVGDHQDPEWIMELRRSD